jgi:hypothetical protein
MPVGHAMSAHEDQPAGAGGTPQEKTGSDKRRHPRRKVLWTARLRCSLGERPCTVLNLSRSGAYLRLDVTLDRGASVQLMVPGIGPLDGQVLWSNHDRAGIEFDALSEALGGALDQALRGRRLPGSS